MKKNNLRVCVFIIAFLLCSSLSGLNALQEGLIFDDPSILISLDFQDASLKDVLKILSIQSGLNFIASEAVRDRQFTVYFDQVPVKDAMDQLFMANNLTYELDRSANIFIVKDWGKPDVELETKVFYLKYASVSSSHLMEEVAANLGSSGGGSSSGDSGESSESDEDSGGDRYAVAEDIGMTTAIKKLLSDKGSIIEDYRTNSLIIQDIPSRMPIIEETLAKLDVPQPLIMIEVEMLDASKSLVDKLGFNWGQTPLTMDLIGPQYTGFGLANGPLFLYQSLSGQSKSMTPGSMKFNQGTPGYQVSLDLLKSDSRTKYLARPKILTLNNETAEFKITTQETVDVADTTVIGSSTAVGQDVQRVETGITLRVTPQLNMDTGEITMFVMPSVKDTSQASLSTEAGAIYDPEERVTKSIVRVRDGQTIILGGLIRHKQVITKTKVPFFGDLPIVGALFRHKDRDTDTERELLVFITPHVIEDKGMELAKSKDYLPLASLPVREQDVSSVIDRKSIINASLNGFKNN